MFSSIQSFFRHVGHFASLNANSNGSTNSETNLNGLIENRDKLTEWVVNPDRIISEIYKATERQAAFPREIVNLVTEYLQSYEILKFLSMFGPADWKTTFNKKVEMIQPPLQMEAFLRRINPFTGKLNAESCLCVFIPSHYQDIPQNTKEEQELVNHPLIPLTPATMEELEKNPSNPENQSKFRVFLDYPPDPESKETREELLNLHAKTSYWVVITSDAIPGSTCQPYYSQEDLIREKGGGSYWKAPSIREVIICAFAHYAKTGVKLFNGNFTRCVEHINGFRMSVGDFTASGLFVGIDHTKFNGIVASRRFF